MNMPVPILAIVVRPQDCRVLDADLLGKPAGKYLVDALRACPGVEVAISDQVTDHDRSALIVDARAWMPGAVVAAVVERARQSDAGFRVGAGDFGAAGEQVRLLESMTDLAAVEGELLAARAQEALSQGARLRDPASVRIRGELVVGTDVEIDVDVIFEGHVVLGNRVRVGAHCILSDASVEDGTRILPYSLVERSSVGGGSFVGPYARIRPGCTIGDRVQIGNYVEIKASTIGTGSRINHHAFIGDAELAEDVTIGAGTITCNHDGVRNTRTVIERGAYVGSGCNLVAPLRVGEHATIGAGSTITSDVPPARLTLARSRQTTIENWQGPRKSES
jgi:bifunctional UDP-N-acetylglucosamine pyrophosphorylase/glucosamine-1-phosphate N-acetyltransferase